jgi:hypothetical protein
MVSAVVIFVIVLVIIGILGGSLWFLFGKGTDSGDGGGDGSGDGTGAGTGTEAKECTSYFNMVDASGCQGNGQAGVKWKWDTSGADGKGQACQDKTAGYDVTFNSSYMQDVIMPARVTGGNAIAIGVKNIPGSADVINNSTLTFTVNPVDKDNNSLISNKVTQIIDRSSVSSDCSAQGITSQLQDIVPFWNSKLAFWPVTVYVTGDSTTDIHVQVWDKNNVGINDQKLPIYQTGTYYVPKGGVLQLSCWIAAGEEVKWTYDQLVRQGVSSMQVHCSLGWFKTNYNGPRPSS